MECPRCGAALAAQMVYGLPDAELGEAARRGEVALGGCVVDPAVEEWKCQQCGHGWVTAEGGPVADELRSMTLGLRAGTVDCIDVRPSPAIGMFFRIDLRSGVFRVRLVPNLYWPDDPDTGVIRQLDQLGWETSGLHGWREMSCQEDERLVDELAAAHAVFDRELTDASAHSSPDDRQIPKGPHAVLFWDWKDAPPFEEFTEASDALLALGVPRVVFNAVDTGEDTYGLVIADRELAPLQALKVWNIFWTECPEDIADWVMVRYREDGTYDRVRP